MEKKEALDIVSFVQNALSNPFFVAETTEEDKKNKIMQFFDRQHTEEYYNKKNYLSASFIRHVLKTYFMEYEYGTLEQKEVNFSFGKAFEEACFENNVIFDNLTIEDYEKIVKMVEVVKPFIPKTYIRDKEIYGSFEYKGYDLKIKGKIDIFTQKKIIDLKTTKCTTLQSFEKNCVSFGYYTQGFLYSTLVKNKPFELLVCSKTELQRDGFRCFSIPFGTSEFEQGKARFIEALEILKKFDLLKHFI